jgi:hypothetical protein
MFFLSDGRSLHGFLDRLRENLEALDEQVCLARKNSKGKGGLQWAKLTRDLIEQRNLTLDRIKAHLLGRTEVGNIKEPEDYYGSNPEVEFERTFQIFLSQWTRKDLKLPCTECQKASEDVTQRRLVVAKDAWGNDETQYRDLCPKCFKKLQSQFNEEMLERAKGSQSTTQSGVAGPNNKLEEILAQTFQVGPTSDPQRETQTDADH